MIFKHIKSILISLSIVYFGLLLSHPTFPNSVSAQHGMVVTQDGLATRVGVQILKDGGNAVDAAVAVGFALSVTLPRAGNIGGGGFMMVYLADTKQVVAIDYRERAPLSAYQDMFLNPDGQVNTQKIRHSLWASGVPGTVSGLFLAHKQYGVLPFSRVIQPAINLAENGFILQPDFINSLKESKEMLFRSAETKRVFFKPNGTFFQVGDRFKQPDLAWSLRQIQHHGPNAFYRGAIAKKIVGYMSTHKGLITHQDLSQYSATFRSPIHSQYHGYDVYAMPPPSSGGVHLIQMLNILSAFPLKEWGPHHLQTYHVLSEVMKRAYADRSIYLGDPDFVDVPVYSLTSKKYAKHLQQQISLSEPTPSTDIAPGLTPFTEHLETTHFSVIDQWGNAVSNTYTLNFAFGNGHVVPGTGILLNNEMDDFSAKLNAPNAYGLIGSTANAIAPQKRMLSSMTPTIVLKDKRPFLITGSPGGSQIITTVLQLILNVIDHDMSIDTATQAPRIHHQWQPDTLVIESPLPDPLSQQLRSRGHTLRTQPTIGGTQSILINETTRYGSADPRKPGSLALGY